MKRPTYFMRCYQRLRNLKFRLLSDCQNVSGTPILGQPVQLVGNGQIKFNGEVMLGFYPSPYCFNGHIYIEAGSVDSVIEIGDGVFINNNAVLRSEGPGIVIGNRTMLGWNCEILDSDFHDIHPDRRVHGVAKMGKVIIGENVLIGSNVKIFKGVTIGNNAVVANGTVVTRSVPENGIIFGNPARGGVGMNIDAWAE